MIIYLAGPYSPIPRKRLTVSRNIAIARTIAIQLWEEGYTVFCPHLNTQNFEKDCNCSYEDYLRGDLEILERCDAVVLIPHWRDSKGVKKERRRAIKFGIPIYEYPHRPPKEIT